MNPTVQEIANDSTHVAQAECYARQQEKLYRLLCLFTHLRFITNEIPPLSEYTQYQKSKEKNLQILKDKFVPANATEKTYEIVVGDLLQSPVEVIAHQFDCNHIQLRGRLANTIFTTLGVNACIGRIPDHRNPKNATTTSQATPGAIKCTQSTVNNKWVVHMFAQQEDDISLERTARIAWFSHCLYMLANFMTENNLKTVAFPYLIGCKYAGGDWIRYEATIELWARANKNRFQVFIVMQDN